MSKHDAKQLLLVDDDRHILESMADWLREQGYELDTASGFEQAIDLIEKRPLDKTYDLVLEAIRAGAFDLLTKPLIDEELEMAIERSLNQRQVLEENKTLKAQLDMRFG